LPYQRNDVVSFVKLRGGSVKIGSDVSVEEGYNFVFVYYNKVCDILQQGEYKIDESVIPKLYHASKAYTERKNVFGSQKIKTDAYYVSLKEAGHNIFKTQERIVAYKGETKVKIKLEGTFSFKVIETDKFMKALCEDYAVFRNKKVVKEICSTIGFEIAKAVNGKGFTLDDFFYNKDEVIQTISQSVNNHTNTFGVEAFKFFINRVIVPKKYLTSTELKTVAENNEKAFKQTKTQKVEEDKKSTKQPEVDSDVVKLVEERLNNLQKDLNLNEEVSVGANYTTGQSKTGSPLPNLFNNPTGSAETRQENKNVASGNTNSINDTSEINFYEDPIFAPNGQFTREVNNEDVSFKTSSLQPEPNVIQLGSDETLNNANKDNVEINDEFVDNLIDKISKRKKQKRDSKIVEILNKAGVEVNSTTVKQEKKPKVCIVCGAEVKDNAKYCVKCGKPVDELKVCACCGAKNFAGADVCCVCKSKLD